MLVTLGPPKGTIWSPCFPNLGQEGEVVEGTVPSHLGCPGAPCLDTGPVGRPKAPRPMSQKHRPAVPTHRTVCSYASPRAHPWAWNPEHTLGEQQGTPWEHSSTLQPGRLAPPGSSGWGSHGSRAVHRALYGMGKSAPSSRQAMWLQPPPWPADL